MSLRSIFSRLLSPHLDTKNSAYQNDNLRISYKWWQHILRFFMAIAVILSAVWLLLAVGYQFGIKTPITWLAILVVVGLAVCLCTVTYLPRLVSRVTHKPTSRILRSRKWIAGAYAGFWLIGLGWFFSIDPQQDRDWKPEVSEVLSYTRDADNPDLITFTNVRNFDWYAPHTDDDEITANDRWETRTVDMSKLSGVDVINSYWMGPLLAHTLVSFRIEDDRPLSFSFEIRKEESEKFSALAGFFRRFELSLIASEERDIIYTRTNARGEQVYLFPISHLQQGEVKALFESYLSAADELSAQPAWYNTLTSNCTNIIFYMARIVSGDRLPWDYRIWVSGWLPNYLHNVGMLDDNSSTGTSAEADIKQMSEQKNAQPWSMETWYEKAHINPKVIGFDNSVSLDATHNSRVFSEQIRQGLPMPPLADTQAEAEDKAFAQAKILEE